MLVVALTIIAVVVFGWPWWAVPAATLLAIILIVVTPTPWERRMMDWEARKRWRDEL